MNRIFKTMSAVLVLTLFFAFSVYAGCGHSDEDIDISLKALKLYEPTCEEEGYTLYECMLCGEFYKGKLTPSLGHDFSLSENKSNIRLNDDLTHSYLCKRKCGSYGTVSGGVGASESCDFKLFSSIEGDCLNRGIDFYFCSVCYKDKEVFTDYAEHSFEVKRISPTCNGYGCDLYICSLCGYTKETNFCEPLEHIPDSGTVFLLPDYGKQGCLRVSCRICDAVLENKIIEALEHEASSSEPERVTGIFTRQVSPSYVKLVWDRADGALSYEVYYGTDKKKWKTLTADSNKITIKSLKSAKKYYIKIRAIGYEADGEFSEAFTFTTKPSRCKILSIVSKRADRATITWKEMSGVSGYELYYTSDSFAKKKSVKKITVKKANKKRVGGLVSGKKYKFKIRAFKAFGGQKLFGAYSKIKTVKIK